MSMPDNKDYTLLLNMHDMEMGNNVLPPLPRLWKYGKDNNSNNNSDNVNNNNDAKVLQQHFCTFTLFFVFFC